MKKRSSSKKPEMSMNYLLKSRNVLYVVLFLSVANLFSYLMMKQLDAVAFFIIIGFLTTYFSKNMIIIMLTAVVSTFFLVQIKMLGNVKEGMTEGKEGKEEEKEEGKGEEEEEEEAINGLSTPEIPITEGQRSKITAANEPLTGGPPKARMSSQSKTQTDGFAQKLSPANYNQSDDDTMPNKKPKFDYADTVESAYDNLDKLLSSDAIKNMADDTGRLAEKQQQLMGHMDKVAPMVEKAAGLMEKFDFSKISGMTDMLKNSMANVDTKAKAFSESLGKKK